MKSIHESCPYTAHRYLSNPTTELMKAIKRKKEGNRNLMHTRCRMKPKRDSCTAPPSKHPLQFYICITWKTRY